MKKSFWLSLGFLLFLLGFTALVLMIVGIQLTFLAWIDKPGLTFGLIVRLLMIIVGLVIVYLTATDWRNQDEDPE